MKKQSLFAMTAVGLVAAIAVPTIAFGNARNNQPGAQATQTALVTQLSGANEVPPADPDGFGSASVTFDLAAVPANVCWDLSYGNLTGTPILAHIHGPAPAGSNANVVIGFTPFTTLTPTGAHACRDLTAPEATIAADIVAHPDQYYVNVHTTDFPSGAIRGQLATGPAPSGEARMLPEPLRAYDSRATGAGGPLAINNTRKVSLASGLDGAGVAHLAVPAGATGAIVTLTVTNTGTGVGGAGGFLKLFSGAISTPPSISTINWFGGGQNIATTTQVAVDENGQVNVFAGANQTDFIIDVIGYTF